MYSFASDRFRLVVRNSPDHFNFPSERGSRRRPDEQLLRFDRHERRRRRVRSPTPTAVPALIALRHDRVNGGCDSENERVVLATHHLDAVYVAESEPPLGDDSDGGAGTGRIRCMKTTMTTSRKGPRKMPCHPTSAGLRRYAIIISALPFVRCVYHDSIGQCVSRSGEPISSAGHQFAQWRSPCPLT